jgi:CBS domain-containing protein
MEPRNVPTAREIMTTRVVTLSPESTASEAAETLLAHEISGAPVVDGDGRLRGLISEYDCLRVVAAADYEMDGHDRIQTVEDLMSRELHTAAPDAGLFSLAHEFVRLRVQRLPVVEGGRLIGLVSRRDVLRAALEVQKEIGRSRSRYPDYPDGRTPIRDYPGE